MQLILGSMSESRNRILHDLGFPFVVMRPNIDEKVIRHSDPVKLVLALAYAKAEALLPSIHEQSLLITSDQVVVWNGTIREKPIDQAEARYFLKSAHEYPAETVTSVVVTNTKTGERFEGVDRVQIFFLPLPEEVIEALIIEGNVFRCAGGFMVEDLRISPFILRLEGDMNSVMGLPKILTKKLLQQAGMEI